MHSSHAAVALASFARIPPNVALTLAYFALILPVFTPISGTLALILARFTPLPAQFSLISSQITPISASFALILAQFRVFEPLLFRPCPWSAALYLASAADIGTGSQERGNIGAPPRQRTHLPVHSLSV
jgi:hypothetical protein